MRSFRFLEFPISNFSLPLVQELYDQHICYKLVGSPTFVLILTFKYMYKDAHYTKLVKLNI